jgi:uncharacterized protein
MWTALDNSAPAIQGPPGAGKTFTGARMICQLVAQGVDGACFRTGQPL